MHLIHRVVVVFLVLSSLSGLQARASENILSDSFATMEKEARHLCKKYHGCENVIAGYDIDNTLLDPAQELGSDEWFTWQSQILPAPGQPRPKNAVASDIGSLIDAFGLLADLYHSHPVDPIAPQVVRKLQDKGIRSLVVTARGDALRDVTIRELERNGYDFSRRPIGTVDYFGTYKPYDPARPEDNGITAEEVARFKLSQNPLPVSYKGGVYMVAGQHKGAMLRALLEKTGAKPKAILYIDDTPVQVERMQDAFKDSGIEVVTIQFTKTYPRVVKFFESDKSEVVDAWDTLQKSREKQ